MLLLFQLVSHVILFKWLTRLNIFRHKNADLKSQKSKLYFKIDKKLFGHLEDDLFGVNKRQTFELFIYLFNHVFGKLYRFFELFG